MDEEEREFFKKGAKAMFDSFLMSAVNTDDELRAIILTDHASEALDTVSPESANEWKDIRDLQDENKKLKDMIRDHASR